jgi:glycolate oxidase FAD binding subunit
MTATPPALELVEQITEPDTVGLPEARFVVSPATPAEAATVLRYASDERLSCLIWGGGTGQDQGNPVEAEMVITTRRMTRLVDWQAEDLTLVVESGMRLADLNEQLAERGQTALLQPVTGEATIGGAVATAASSWARLRYGPLRDRVLQTSLVTGDGRVVTAGGRVVKNVTGYDIPRLATGSYGALGLIGAVCLKLWPVPAFAGSVQVEDPVAALADAYRPLAVIQTDAGCWVYLGGTEADVRTQAERLGGDMTAEIEWPAPLSFAHQWVMRVPPDLVSEAVVRCREAGMKGFQAAHGVGEVRMGTAGPSIPALEALRGWAEQAGGGLVRMRGRLPGFDPWGSPPASLALQRAVQQAFDPVGVVNPGRLPGGL